MATAIQTQKLAAADTEYSLSLGTIKTLSVRCRDKLADFRIALAAGHVAGSSVPFLFVPYPNTQTLSFAPAQAVTLYMATSDTGQPTLEIVAH